MTSILTVTASADSRALADAETVRRELGIPEAEGTATVLRMIRAASAVIEGWCGRVFVMESVQEVFRGETGECLNLGRYPVASISSVVGDGVTLAAEEYELDASAGQLWALSGDSRCSWRGRKVSVTYAAGYDPIPDDVTQACITLVTSYYQGQGRDLSVRSESAQDVGQVAWLDPRAGMEALLPQVAGILAPYRRFA